MSRVVRWMLVLMITALALPLSVSAQPDAVEIEIGDTVTGDLSEETPTVLYSFEGEADQAVTLTLVSEEFDSYLTLQDSEGNTLIEDDDSAGRLDSQITGYVLPEDGTYFVLAQSLESARGEGFQSGAFTLSLTAAQSRVIEYGMSIEGALTPAETSVFYTFRGDEGDTILITLIAEGGWDAYLNLYEGSDTNSPLVSNDDSAGNLNSLLGPYTLPSGGVFTIEATSFSREATGEYDLTLERAEVITLGYGDSVEATLTEDDSFVYYQFEGEQGDIIDLTVEGGADLGTSLVLNGPDGYQVNYSDSYSGVDPTVNDFQLTQSGTYTILVRTLDAGNEGKVTISLAEAELVSLDEGAQTVEFSSSVTRNSLTFTAEQGEVITLTLNQPDGTSVSPSISVIQDGITLSYISASSVNNLTATFEVPEDGSVFLQIDEFSYIDNTLEVSIERSSG